MAKQDFGGVVYIHSHLGKPLYIEFFSVSGREVDINFIRYMANNNEPEVLVFFSMLKLETVYQVVGQYWFEDNSFCLEVTGYVECCPPDFTEEDDDDYPCGCESQHYHGIPF
jgi:hypothetical protein